MSLDSYTPTIRRRLKGRDWSGLTLDHFSGRMLAIRNSSPRLAELGADGRMIRRSPRLDLEDSEDLAVWHADANFIWIYVVEERPNRLALLKLRRDDLEPLAIWRWSLGPSKGNRGPEGVTIDWVRCEIVICYEKPARLMRIDLDLVEPDAGELEGELKTTPIEGIRDAAAIQATKRGTFVISDESAVVVNLRGTMRLPVEHKQAEGMAFEEATGRLWVLGEPGELVIYEQSGQAASVGQDEGRDERFELLPAEKSVVEAGIATGFAGEVLECFDATSSSRRHYDHTNKLDRRTFWTSHSHQGNGHDHFERMRRDKRAWAALGKRALELGIGLSKIETLCESWWWERDDTGYGQRRGRWLDDLLRYAGRDRTIAEWQWKFWRETIFEDALEDAKKAGLMTKGAIASLASAESSASSWDEKIVDRLIEARETGSKMRFGGGSWRIAQLPEGLSEAQRIDYESLVVWRAYAEAKDDLRTRMIVIWKRWYEPTWGPLPAPRDEENPVNWEFEPRHTGVPMALFEG